MNSEHQKTSTKGKWSYRKTFKDGKLIEFSKRDIVVSRAWGDKSGCWRRTKTKGWQHIRHPSFSELIEIYNMGFPTSSFYKTSNSNIEKIFRTRFVEYACVDDEELTKFKWYSADVRQYLAVHDYMIQIPKSILSRVSKLNSRHWHMLQLFNRVPQSVELFDSNPALAYMLASSWVFHPTTNHMRAVRSAIVKKHTDILGWLGFPSEKRILKVLKKINISDETLSIQFFLFLKKVYLRNNPSEIKIWSHIPHVNENVMWFSVRGFSGNILHEIALLPFTPTNLKKLKSDHFDLLGYEKALKKYNIPNNITDNLRFFSSIKCLTRYKEKLAYILFSYSFDKGGFYRKIFPKQPIPNYQSISGLTTFYELLSEANLMQHCVLDYIPNIHMKKSYIYKFNPTYKELGCGLERCTIELKNNDTDWSLSDIRGEYNENISQKTRDYVTKWLSINTAEVSKQEP